MIANKTAEKSSRSFLNRLRNLADGPYDVAVSVRATDPGTLEAAEELTARLQRQGLKVYFYRDQEQVEETLGHPLHERLLDIYYNKARQVVVIGSENYGTEGTTRLEWETIRRRMTESPSESFLIPVSTVPVELLPRDFARLAFIPFEGGLQPVSDLVFKRLGRWPLVKTFVTHLVLASALISVAAHWMYRSYLSSTATVMVPASLFMGCLWWAGFRILPRLRPSLIYAPTGFLSLAYQRLYRNFVLERLSFSLILFLSLLAHIVLPSTDLEINSALTDWLSGDSAHRAAALRLFDERLDREQSLGIWTTILVDSDLYGPNERGKALDMISRLMAATEGGQPVTKDLSSRLRSLADKGAIRSGQAGWIGALSGMDARNLNLDHFDFSRLYFSGPETLLANASIQQTNMAACHFQAVNLDGVDARGSDFSRVSFWGVQGNVHFDGAYILSAIFFGCDLKGSSFYGADVTGSRFEECDLSGADFTNAYLAGVTFRKCNLSGAKFTAGPVRWKGRWGDLAGILFDQCILFDAQLRDSNLEAKTLSFFPVLTANPSNLNQSNMVFGRDSILGKDSDKLTVMIPGAALIECDFQGEGAAQTDFDSLSARGILIDTTTWRALSTLQRKALIQGGFNPETVLSPISQSGELEERFPVLKEVLWGRIQEQLGNLSRRTEK